MNAHTLIGDLIRVLALSIVCAVPFSAAHAQDANKDLFAPATVEQVDQFIDSIRSHVALDTPPQNVSQNIDGAIAGLWAGSKVKVDSMLGPLVLRFRPKTQALLELGDAGDVSGSALLESFEITLTPEEERLRIEHSHVADRRDAGGFYARIDRLKDPTRLAFVEGQKDSGFYMAVPIARNPITNWGIFICPRRFVGQDAKNNLGIELKPSSYELSEAFFKLDLNAQATMATAGQKGRVTVEALISPGLPPAKVGRDEAVSTLPAAGVSYLPSMPFDFFRFAPFKDVQQGVVTLVEMQNKAGYIRRQYFSHQRMIHKTEEPTPVNLVVRRRQLTNDSGECYVIIEQRYSWMTYDKKPPTFQ